MKALERFHILLTVVIIVCLLTVACGPTAEPTGEAPPVTTATKQTATVEAPQAAKSEKYGGILRHASLPPSNLDPAFYGTIPDDIIGRQWLDVLVFIGEDNEPDVSRGVAESWVPSADGTEWTFKLRKGVLFHDGKEMTSRDVKFSFDRLRNPELGAATVELYANITDIAAADDYTVVFRLENPNPDFLKDLGDYHAHIVDADTEDFATDWNGTGAFFIESYNPEDRLVFKRNPNYWLKDEEGNQLPYVDGMEFIFIPDSTAQVEALRGGQIDWIIYLPAEFVDVLKNDPNTVVYQSPSNTVYLIHMRSDREPAGDVRFRQALKAATDRQAILDTAWLGLGTVGRDTPFGPIYGDFFLDVPPPQRDVEKARQLLAEAGYPDGVEIEVYCQDRSPVPAICTVWKEQLAEAGIIANIQIVPSDVYYGADNMWLEVDFGVTDWGSRPYPQPYLELAYTCDAAWNESHFCDKELDDLATLAAKEMDHETRVSYYHQIQEIFMERGPIILPFFLDNLYGASSRLKGVRPTMGLPTAVDLRYVYIEE